MKVKDLYHLATESFGLDIDQTATKPQIVAALAENGVNWETAVVYDQAAKAWQEANSPKVDDNVITSDKVNSRDEEEGVEARDDNIVTSDSINKPTKRTRAPKSSVSIVSQTNVPAQVLIKMDRENPTYQIRGYTFTGDHPFAIVDSENAEYIVSYVEGFRYATPKEAQEFYG